MSKNIVSLSATAGKNKFLNNDNHLNAAAVKELEDKIQGIVKGLPVTNAKGKVIKMPIPEKTFTVNRRKKIEKFDSTKNKNGDLNYLGKRALPVKETKRLTDRGAIRNMAMLTIYPADKMEKAYGEDPFLKMRKTIKEAVKAFAVHMKRADKTKESVKVQKTKIRDESNSVFAKAIAAFKAVLKAGGAVDMNKDMVESVGMAGKTVLLRVGKDLVVSIGKSDALKFKTAKAKAAAVENGEEPAKKGFGAKKSTKEAKPAKKLKKVSKEEKVVKKVKKADKTSGKKKSKK